MDSAHLNTKTWGLLAEWYNDTFMLFDLYNDTYDFFLSNLSKEDASILELGCGPGNITNYLLSKRTKLKILGTDSSSEMIEVAKRNVPNAEFRVMDCRDLMKFDVTVDGIVCGFCIPYISVKECEILLENAFQLLNSTGVLYLSFIEGSSLKSGFERDSQGKNKMYVNYFLVEELQLFLANLGFEENKLFQKNYTRKNGIEEIHSIIIAKK